MTKAASELMTGDTWLEGPDIVRMVRAEPHLIPSVIRLVVERISDGTRMTLDFHRVDRREIIA